jgi:hypothetical protein
MSHLSSTSPPCRGGTCPGRLPSSDAVNVLYPRWGISMRRRTGAVEASGHRILSLTVRFSPDHGMTPEPLLTAAGYACKPAGGRHTGRDRNVPRLVGPPKLVADIGNPPAEAGSLDHPMTLSGASRTVGYQRRQRDERGLRFVQIDLDAICTAFICGPNDSLPDRPGLRRRTRAGEPKGAGIRGDRRRLEARYPVLVAGARARVANVAGGGFDRISAEVLLT